VSARASFSRPDDVSLNGLSQAPFSFHEARFNLARAGG